jgi:hypothetical protein
MGDLRDLPLSELTVEIGTRPARPDLGVVDAPTRQAGKHLAAIHRHYLMEMGRIGQVLRRIEAGDTPPADLRDIVLNADMTQNFRAFGTICGQECKVLTMHHDIEEQAIFPQLHASGSEVIRAIVERLRAEHLVVHEVLERLAAVADDLAATPDAAHFAKAGAVFDKLWEVVKSHFHYEETTLEEALGVYGIQI